MPHERRIEGGRGYVAVAPFRSVSVVKAFNGLLRYHRLAVANLTASGFALIIVETRPAFPMWGL